MITDYFNIIIDYVGPFTYTDILITIFGIIIVFTLGGKK